MRKRSSVREVLPSLEGDRGAELKETLAMPPPPESSAAPTWDNAHAAQGAALESGFDRIVEVVFVDDPMAAYEKLERSLRIGERRGDHGALMKALDEAESNARLAHRLYVSAVVERKRWELENEVVFGIMRKEATHALQREKDQGYRSKQITDADVSAMCATMWPDEWRAQEMKRARVKAMEDTLGNLVESCMSRCRSVQTMLGKSR